MKWLSYCWSMVLGLIQLIIAFAVINRFDAPFERVVVDLLVLIYVAVGRSFLGLGVISSEGFLMLMKATGDRQFESEDNQETLKDNEKIVVRATVKTMIRIQSVFLSLIWLVAILNLLRAL